MKTIILLGGSGYVGTHLIEYWLKADSQVKFISLSRSGKPKTISEFLSTSDRVEWRKVDVFDIESYVADIPEKVDAIIELIGTATADSDAEFDRLNVDTAKVMVELMKRLSIHKGCYLSGVIGMPGKSKTFLRSKREGEAAAKSGAGDVAIIRPSLVYGDRPGVAVMVAMMKVMGLFNRKLWPIKIDTLAKQIIESVS